MFSRLTLGIGLVLCILVMGTSAHAQNNPYRIDDECYNRFVAVDKLVGQPSFDDTFQSFLSLCDSKSDAKARTLAYTLSLKNATVLGDDTKVDRARLNLMREAKSSGYMQYYSYAYTSAATYYFNTRRKDKTINLLEKLNKESIENNDEYGRWTALRYLANIYTEMHDYVTSKAMYLEALDIYNSSTNATLRAQSLNKLYTDLAWSYSFDNDSLSLFIDKAAANRIVRLDSVRNVVNQVFLAKLKNDTRNYNLYREQIDLKAQDDELQLINRQAPLMIECLDEIGAGHWDIALEKSEDLDESIYIRILSSIAQNQGRYDSALIWYDRYVKDLQSDMYEVNSSSLAEMRSLLDNDRLTRELLEKTQTINEQRTLQLNLLIAVIVVGLILMYFYIKSLLKARTESEEARKLAEAASNMKTNFVQNMSHEIRTPLNAIVGFSQLLTLPDGFVSENEKNQYASYITNNSNMLTMLIDDILDLSDVDKGNYRVTFGNCYCNTICRNAMNTVECRVPGGIEYVFETDAPDDFEIYSDEKRVQQVLINYLTNACKHTETGKITVGCSLTETPGMVTFSVTDTGEGIPPEAADSIFQRFTKLNEFKQGSGLGLNICMTIAEKLKGSVSLDRTYGRCSGKEENGSRFLFVVPVKPEGQPYTGLV